MKTCNAFALHMPTEEFVNFILSASEMHENMHARICKFHLVKLAHIWYRLHT